MANVGAWEFQLELGLHLLAALAAGLLIGIERGWRQREEPDGTRVAGIRTFTLIGGAGGLVSLCALHLSPILGGIMLAGIVAVLVLAFLRPRTDPARRDATTMVAAMDTLLLGLLAGAGLAALALAGAALTTLILGLRKQSHRFLKLLTPAEMRAIARFAVIAIAVPAFLPDAQFGPYDAWNPLRLWLVVVLVTGLSVIGYVANRIVGESRGTITTALIGGAYSSTAVTASLASKLEEHNTSPFATGIALASAVMYLRVILLALVLAPSITLHMAGLLGPALVTAFAAAGFAWRGEREARGTESATGSKPFELLPALVFLLAVAGASLLVAWAQAEYGEAGGALSLFLAGSFDVDAAIVAFSTLPRDAVTIELAAFALSGTVAVNMAFKAGIVFANAGFRKGRTAGLALVASLAVLLVTLAIRALMLFA
jgi:uncharacterized membrane protein (DUF4010 family)